MFIQNNIYYKYEDLSDNYHRAQHEYNIYDDENNLIHKYLFNKDTYYDESLDPILHTNEDFCICFKKNYKKIKIHLLLHRHNRHGYGSFNLEIDDNFDNYINVTCTDDQKATDISDNSTSIETNASSISDNSTLIETNTSSISDNKGLIEVNASKINNMENNLIEVDDIYNQTFTIQNFTLSDRTALFYYKTINLNFTTNGIIKINAKYNYLENYNLTHIYRFYSNRKLFKEIKLENTSNIDKFEIQSIDSTSIDIGIHYENNNDNKIIKLLSNSTIQFNYINNIHKLNINKNNIASNLTKINENTTKINEINELIKNIKAFYNLDQIFIYDIEKGYKLVDKNNHFHIFEKEMTLNFIKNSYLEIALKVLTKISNYVLIGHFQILCNFYDQDNNLFYTISLSTAMGSINKLSTIKSVFIIPINENMSKIKIDFFIAPKETQQNRSAKFVIQDINSNKIYIKYFQKTEEMSIKDIQDSLDNVKKINDSIKLKNIKNILFYDEKEQIDFKNNFFDKSYLLNIKKDDFIEIDLRMLLDYENIDNSHIIITEFRLYNDDDDEQIYTGTFNNGDYISHKNFVFINKNIFYNFEKDTTKLRVLIFFYMLRSEIVKIWYEPKNLDRFIIKHYRN